MKTANITTQNNKAAPTVWFVSRHPGALHWMQTHGPAFDRHVAHLDPAQVQAGDTVIGTLPIQLAAQICARHAAYWHLSLEMPANKRGQELSAQELETLGASLQRFDVHFLVEKAIAV